MAVSCGACEDIGCIVKHILVLSIKQKIQIIEYI